MVLGCPPIISRVLGTHVPASLPPPSPTSPCSIQLPIARNSISSPPFEGRERNSPHCSPPFEVVNEIQHDDDDEVREATSIHFSLCIVHALVLIPAKFDEFVYKNRAANTDRSVQTHQSDGVSRIANPQWTIVLKNHLSFLRALFCKRLSQRRKVRLSDEKTLQGEHQWIF